MPLTVAARPHWLLLAGGTALVYFLVGAAALPLALPPGQVTPLFPSAGIALVALLLYGRRMALGVLVGALALNLLPAGHREQAAPWGAALPLILALSAALQAVLGAVLVRRYVQEPLALNTPGQVTRFYLAGGAAACLLNASVVTAVLWAQGSLASNELFVTWTTGWIGDTMGVLIGAPIVLTVLGRPREAWEPRRLTVGLPLLIVAVLLGLAIGQIVRWDRERSEQVFARDAATAERVMAERLREPLTALEAMRGLFIVTNDVSQAEFKAASAAWLKMPIGVQGVGWSEAVAPENLAAFEEAVRADGQPGYQVFDRAPTGEHVAPAPGQRLVAIRYIEPLEGNQAALGVNGLSLTQAGEAILASQRLDAPRATAGLRLTQEAQSQLGVVVYRSVFAPSAAAVAGSAAPAQGLEFKGVVFVSLRMDDTLAAIASTLPSTLTLCLIEKAIQGGAPSRRLAGAAGCDTASALSSAGLQRTSDLEFAGRRWQLRVAATPAALGDGRNWNAWLLSLVGLMGAAMMGALLLTVTGRAQRIEQAVRERTSALEREIVEREETAAALRDSEQRFRNIFNNVPIGVTYTDLQGRVMQSNPRFCQLTGYSADELLHMTSFDYTHPEDRAQDIELSAQLVRGHIPMYRRHERYIAKNGQVLWVQATVSLLRDAQGRARRIVGVVEDITEHLRLLEAERARETAEAANKAKSDFLSRMSHELRTPLNAMLGFAQLLELDERQPLSTSQRQWAGQIQQAGWHLLEMINDVLDLSRIESGTLRLELVPLKLPELVASCLSLVQAAADRRGITITHAIAHDTTAVMGDATRVKQILTNLLSNAVKYNCDAGRIHINTRLSGPSTIEIAVTDTGLGMTAEQLSGLFQPFNRLGRERSHLEGTGIGLVISQRLAELMGGVLRARSVSGEGSSFIVSLPCAIDPDSLHGGLDLIGPTPAEYRQRLVHYIEDNETNIEVMRGILAQRPQIKLGVSMTGEEGLMAIRATHPSLLLLDLHLPDINGLEVLTRLKADPAIADIPVVVVSADALSKQMDALMAAGAYGYITKPVSVARLLATVDELLLSQDTRFD